MNPTIVKIIDLMFRGIPETEEIAAMREELLTNSQARYEDLIAAGESPNTALGQVLDNLRGMEDVLDEYKNRPYESSPQRNQSSDDAFPFAKFERMAEEIDDKFERLADKAESTAKTAFDSAMDGLRTAMDSVSNLFNNPPTDTTSPSQSADPTRSAASLWQPAQYDDETLFRTFSPSEVSRINVQLIGEDIEIEPSTDGLIHVEISRSDEPLYMVETIGGCLTIRHNPNGAIPTQPQDTQPQELDGLSGILSGIGQALKGVFRITRTSGDTVRLLLPDGLEQITLQTASGDMDVEGIHQKAFAASTTSGDLELSGCTFTGPVRLNTTSGDLEVTDTLFHDSLSLNTTSGDAEVRAYTPQVTLNTVSGDFELEGDIRQIKANSVSGDLDFHPTGAFQSISANTTSGDISVTIADSVIPNLRTNTTSGDVSVLCQTDTASASLIHLNTVSGDISVENI